MPRKKLTPEEYRQWQAKHLRLEEFILALAVISAFLLLILAALVLM